jgi:hypothetical protein
MNKLSYHEEKAERKEKNHLLFAAIADKLIAKRFEMKSERDALITLDSGRQFYIEHNEYDDKLTISGYYFFYDFHSNRQSLLPYKPYNAVTPTIRVSAKKNPVTIAADIHRRFLPTFNSLMDCIEQRKRESDDYELARNFEAKELAALSGGTFEQATDFNRQTVTNKISVSRFMKSVSGHATVYQGSVNFELRSVPLALAKKIMTAFEEYQESFNIGEREREANERREPIEI